MILKEFTNSTKVSKLAQTLYENYSYTLDLDNMTRKRAAKIISNANNIIKESEDLHKRIKLNLIVESLELWTKASIQTELTETLDDNTVEEAKVILAAQAISSKIQNMIEDAAKMQVQDLIPIVDAMKTEIGMTEASAFSDTVDTTMSEIVSALKTGKDQFDNAIMTVQGIDVPTDMEADSQQQDIGSDNGDYADDDLADDDLADDDFAGDPLAIANDPSGRELKNEG